MAAAINSLDQARTLHVAREVMQDVAFQRGVIWKKCIRYEWQTKLRRPILVELLGNGYLRVTDGKTREVITQGPAWGLHSAPHDGEP
jgi:hypothetical protein